MLIPEACEWYARRDVKRAGTWYGVVGEPEARRYFTDFERRETPRVVEDWMAEVATYLKARSDEMAPEEE